MKICTDAKKKVRECDAGDHEDRSVRDSDLKTRARARARDSKRTIGENVFAKGRAAEDDERIEVFRAATGVASSFIRKRQALDQRIGNTRRQGPPRLPSTIPIKRIFSASWQSRRRRICKRMPLLCYRPRDRIMK